MYKYGATDSIFEGVSNVYLISIATAFLAVILAFYFSNFLKDENESQDNNVLSNDVDENEEVDNYLNDASTEMENHYRLNKDSNKRFEQTGLDNQSDSEGNDSNTNWHLRRNSSANGSSDVDYDTDEIHVDGLVGKLKSKRVKDLEAQLTRDQLEEEKRIEREQLAAIFELLKKQEAELNMKEIDETELNAQLALYR